MRICRRRIEDHLVGGVVRRPDLTSLSGERVGTGYRHQPEVTDQPGALSFVEVARLDVAVRDAVFLLQTCQCLGGLRDRGDDVGQRPSLKCLLDRYGDRHRQPRFVGTTRVLGKVSIEQWEDPRGVLVLAQEGDLADEALVRLLLDLRGVDDLERDGCRQAGPRRLPDLGIATSTQHLLEVPRSDGRAGCWGGHTAIVAAGADIPRERGPCMVVVARWARVCAIDSVQALIGSKGASTGGMRQLTDRSTSLIWVSVAGQHGLH
jgi:hypothetical protein